MSQPQAVVPQAACFVVPRISSWSDYRSARRTDRVDWTTLTTRDRVAVFIPSDTAPQEIRDCLHEEVAQALGPQLLRWVVGGSFLAVAVWMLIPDKIDDDDHPDKQRWGVFGTTVLAFFLAEMGDKTQIATVALAARYHDLFSVVTGTTLGMMLANVPAVFMGDQIARRVSMRLVHGIAAFIFAVLGLLTLLNVGRLF